MSQMTANAKATARQWLNDLRRDGEAELDSYSGKRKSPRFHPWIVPLEIRMDDEIFIAHGENLSLEGVGFVCKARVGRGDVVDIRRTGDNEWLQVRVRHATQTIGSYKVGATFIF
jgi:PilZ domain-containing protein